MAMTKKEKARMAELEEELRIAKAFRFTPPVAPDVQPPEIFREIRKGYLYNAYMGVVCGPRVEPACTSGGSHSFGRDDGATTQGARALYSTELLAWKACRNDIERQAAKMLAGIDKRIEELASNEPTP